MSREAKSALTREQVVHMCGGIPDWKIAAILRSGATANELERALAWVEGESDVAGEARLPLSGRTADLYEILVGDEEVWGKER